MLVTLPVVLLALAALASLIALPSLLVTRARLTDQLTRVSEEQAELETLVSVQESLYDEPRYIHVS